MRYKLTIEYDGTGLLGWQEQQDGPSVQDYLQKSLSCFTPAPADECPQVPNAALDDNDFSAVSYTHLTLPTSDLV